MTEIYDGRDTRRVALQVVWCLHDYLAKDDRGYLETALYMIVDAATGERELDRDALIRCLRDDGAQVRENAICRAVEEIIAKACA